MSNLLSPSPRNPFPLTGKHAIVVEDEHLLQYLIQKIVQRERMLIAGLASNGHSAIDLALQKRPEIVLLDYHLSGTLNGLETAWVILQNYRPCIVILTSDEDPVILQQAQEIGVAGHLLKQNALMTLGTELTAIYERWLEG